MPRWPFTVVLGSPACVRRRGAANSICRQRDELLRPLPDWRQGARRPLTLTAPEGRLAPHDRTMGGDVIGMARLLPSRNAGYGSAGASPSRPSLALRKKAHKLVNCDGLKLFRI